MSARNFQSVVLVAAMAATTAFGVRSAKLLNSIGATPVLMAAL